MIKIMSQREEIVQFLKNLREEIISAFEAFEPSAKFERKAWNHKTGGGGGNQSPERFCF
jgi:coproporphyrinogen III oxidase